MRGDQQYRGADAGRKDRHGDRARQTVVAMHHRDRGESADRLQNKARPLHRIDLRAADDDALQARVERIADRRRDLALRDALAVIVRRQAERQLQRLREERWRKAQRRALMRQFRPFLDDGFVDVCTDQPAQSLARLREIGRQDDGCSERAGLAVDRSLGPLVVVPDLRRDERDKQAKNDPQRRQHAWRDGFEGPRSSASRLTAK